MCKSCEMSSPVGDENCSQTGGRGVQKKRIFFFPPKDVVMIYFSVDLVTFQCWSLTKPCDFHESTGA